MVPACNDNLLPPETKLTEPMVRSPSCGSRKQMKLVQKYYDNQQRLTVAITNDTTFDPTVPEADSHGWKKDRLLAQLTVVLNVALMIALLVAFVLSKSMAILATAVDAAADLTSGVVIWLAAFLMAHSDKHKYPRGRSRLEPLALIVVSSVMAIVNLQVILQSILKIAGGHPRPDMDPITTGILITSVSLKLLLIVSCYLCRSPSTKVLAQDLRNDCLLNIVAITCVVGGNKLWAYLDPVGAILVCSWIIFSWFRTGLKFADKLSGRSASSLQLHRLLNICSSHTWVRSVTNLTAYNWGLKYLVEAEVIIPASIPFLELNQLCAALKAKLEALDFVELAFITHKFDLANPTDPGTS